MGKMMVNLQDSFLNQVRKDNSEIEMVMLDGTRLRGQVRGFDNFTVILHERGSQHLVYKHAIAQIIGYRLSADLTGAPPKAPEQAQEPKEPAAEAAREHRPARQEQRRPRPDRPRERGGDRGERPPQENQERPPRPPREEKPRDRFNTIELGSLKMGEGEETP